MQELVWANICQSALQNNLRLCQQAAPDAKIIAVIKANAYGHGAVQVAKSLDGAHSFAVARLNEAMELRAAGITKPIIVLSGIMHADDIIQCSENNIDIVVHSATFQQLLENIQLTRKANIWLKVDTGMHRLGLDIDKLSPLLHFLKKRDDIHCHGFISHFSSADDLECNSVATQQHVFNQVIKDYDLPRLSIANSAAILFHQQAHYDYIRPGILLYGVNPSSHENAFSQALLPVMTLQARILNIREISAGESVGYNATWTATKKSRIATLAIGYADGYPRHAKNGTPVLIRGKRHALAGRVSMDLITVDVSCDPTIVVGDIATLWGDELPAEEIASWADTIAYQLFTSVSERVVKRLI